MISRIQGSSIAIASYLAFSLLTGAASAFTRIDDHFDNGDIATGGANGGFRLVSNGAGGTGTVTEAGTLATVTIGTAGTCSNDGIYSLSSFDSIAVGSLLATIQVGSVGFVPDANGLFFGITDDNTTFYREQTNFGLVFSGKPGTGSSSGFGLGVNDAGGGFGTTLASGILDLPSLLDGFTAGFTADQTGWSYEISGVKVGGVATTLSDGGSYPVGFEYEEHFDSTDYLTTSIQSCTGNELVMEVDRMVVDVATPPDLPTLQLNTDTGAATILNDTVTEWDMDYYEIASASNSLDPNGWNSLADQDLDGNGPPDGSGNGWEELGTPHSGKIAEAYLRGSMTLGTDDSHGIGSIFDTGTGMEDVEFSIGRTDGSLRRGIVIYGVPEPSADFDHNGLLNTDDIDGLVINIVSGEHDQGFDLTNDGTVDNADVAQWLADAAQFNGFADTYLPGDANLDGTVDAIDLNNLALNWRQNNPAWSGGDFSTDGVVNSADLNALALNWRQSIPAASALNVPVPEPTAWLLTVVGLALTWRRS